jgi:formiminotetrahydrofolate cyclodeaminase
LLDKKTTIEEFLEAAAAKQPTPGGGSVAALAGALAAAMGQMVVNYSLGKKGLQKHEPRLQAALGEFKRAREMMLRFMAEDQQAYEAATAARKLPADDPGRKDAMEQATAACIMVPQCMLVTATDIIELADGMVEIANPRLLSDLAVCAELAMATARAASYNVRVNLPEIVDVHKRASDEGSYQRQLARAGGLIQRVIPRIWERALRE